ncbi:MAG: SHOCT domain-containing protein [Acidiferrobacteraceae bacterium]
MCGGRGTPKGEGSARDILDRRYARGEITREEYQRMGKDLE